MIINVKKVVETAIVPKFAHDGDAGADLYSVEDVVIPAGERRMVATGIAIELPPSTEAQIRPRSGLAMTYGITVLNAPGTIDCGYVGEIKVIMYNTSKEDFHVGAGMKIAQMVVSYLPKVQFLEVCALSTTERGSNGFGSTGIK